MRLPTAIYVLTAMLVSSSFPLPVSAMYHVGAAKFLQRDVGYAGTVNLYDRKSTMPSFPQVARAASTEGITPLPSNSSECDDYPADYQYSGSNARCFCKCAGDTPWAQYVRGCLRFYYEQGMGADAAHATCYLDADNRYPDGRPTCTLIWCALRC